MPASESASGPRARRSRYRLALLVAAPLLVALLVASGKRWILADGPQEEKDRKKPFHYPPFVPRKPLLRVGEKLTYRIKWTTIAAGEATMSVEAIEVHGGGEAYRVVSRARSNRFVDAFYKVRDTATSWIDVREGFSRGFSMRKNEGRHHSREDVRFDYEQNKAYFLRVKGGKERKAEVKLPGKVLDALSVMYYLRFWEFGPGKRPPEMTVATNRKVYKVGVKILGRQRLKVKGLGKTYMTLKIMPKADFPGLFVRKGEMTVWLEEKTRIPLLMEVDVPVGSVTVRLFKAENSALP